MESMLSPISIYTEALCRLFYPASCALCSIELDAQEKGLCSSCHVKMLAQTFSYSDRALASEHSELDTVWSLFPYEGAVKDFLTALKFEKKRWLVSNIREAFRGLAELSLAETGFDCFVPIPPDIFRLAEREFHLPYLLSSILTRFFKIPTRHALRKQPGILPQSNLNREERLFNPYGMFKCSSLTSVRNANILLVDDIYTTGATASEAARVLRSVGARRIDVITLARTL